MYIDLSVPLNEDTPTYPGDPKPQFKMMGKFHEHGLEDHLFSMNTHTGTHIDAPSHMLEGGKGINEFLLEQFVGSGVVIKLENRQYDLAKFQQATINEGDIVLINSGMSDVYHSEEYYKEYPAMPVEVANFLVEKRVKMVGVDMCSIDREGSAAHQALLGNNIPLIENLTNLIQIEDKKFKLYAWPLNLQIDGSPARVVAEVEGGEALPPTSGPGFDIT